MTDPAKRAGRDALLAIGLISCSMLMWEILLTRVCALRLFFHFTFLAVGNCLLGVGASGSLIFVMRERLEARARGWIFGAGLAYLVSLIFSYLLLISLPIEPGIRFVSGDGAVFGRGLASFALFNAVAAFPFFFGGGVVGMLLSFHAADVNRVYASDLLGAGLGCLLAPLLLWWAGAGGCWMLLCALAAAGAVAYAPSARRATIHALGALGVLAGLAALPFVDAWLPVPSKDQIGVTDQVAVDLRRLEYSRWSAISRVDLVDVPARERFLFGRGRRSFSEPIPPQMYIAQDGSAGTYVANFSEHPEGLRLLARTTYGLASSLRPDPRVLVIGVGGGNDVWGALSQGASYVKGVELNRQILDIHRGHLRRYSAGIVEDPRVELLNDEGRSALLKESTLYDVVQMSGIDTWTALASGAYTLAENYLYTVEAMEDMLDRLAEGGVLQISRMGSAMETLRLLANLEVAYASRGGTRFQDAVACVYTWPLMTVLLKRDVLSDEELRAIRDFAQREEMAVIYLPRRPGLPPVPLLTGSDGETAGALLRQLAPIRRAVQRFVLSPDKASFIERFPRNLEPTTDDKPYFFNFTRWSSLGSAHRTIDEAPHVSQGNPLFLLVQLGLSTLLAAALILGPLLWLPAESRRSVHHGRFLVYFSGVGLGFIWIEIVLIQKLLLFLGHPLYSITVTLFSMLVFTGLGSALSERWLARPSLRALGVPLALALAVGAFVAAYPAVVERWIGLPTAGRVALAVALTAPIGLVLGAPFAFGIRLAIQSGPQAVPWCWAVNACATVVGSILAVVVSMNAGFDAVLISAVAIYALSFLAVLRLLRA